MRKTLKWLVPAAGGLCALIACAVFLAIVAAILARGLPALSPGFFWKQMELAGAAGGIFYNLIGTVILGATALALSAPAAVGAALVLKVFLRGERLRRIFGLMLYVANGVPSILFGIFGLIVFVNFLGWGKSWLSGGILLGMIILPTITAAVAGRIEALPRKYIEAAAGLGLSQAQIVWFVILPRCLPGLFTGSLLGLARAVGETAPIMFTATVFAGATIPSGVKENPVLSLPYHIFVLAQDSFNPAAAPRMWGAAAVLLALVFSLSLLALPARLRMHEEGSHA